MASSSSVMGSQVYDVFLSFRGEDTRYSFVSHLHEAFVRAKIKLFIDYELVKGEEITPTLIEKIEAAKISVIIFSADYASSTFCLDELARILECRRNKKQTVLPIFYKVDPSDIRKLKNKYAEAFSKHEARFTEMDKTERWKSALHEASNLSGWHIDDKSNEAKSIGEIIGQISAMLTWKLTRLSEGQKMMSKPLDGLSSTIAQLEKIWKCLINDNTSRVGVHGMGGIGKTTIVIHIYNRLKDENSFQHVYWVTVTKESSIFKLQSDIAKEIELDLSKEDDERRRAERLFRVLHNKKRFVLILDDIWESFESEDIGIPLSVDGKLLLTSREHRVCKGMKCEEIVKIEPLSENEALSLFIRESGHQMDDNSQLRSVVASVAKECDGLPLAIVTLAKSTRAFVEIYEWRNVLRELQRPTHGENHEMEKVFKVLKISYDQLRNDKYRQCLLYCALYPEDYLIERYFLIQCWVGDGLIDELESGQAELDKGNSIINELIDTSLLECRFEELRDPDGKVKMHDMVRDMALTITRENFLVKAGLQLKDFPKFSDWSDNLERISVMSIQNMKKCPFKLAPKCSKLKTLFMQSNYLLMELPSCFFDNMLNLTVLDLNHLLSLRSLPDSIVKLKNLRLLNILHCRSLEYIPSLAGLENLWYLYLSWTSLKELPEGMENLINLKVLDIGYILKLNGSIPSEVLENFPLLQILKLGTDIEVETDALIGLENLETLKVAFKDFESLNSYLESGHWERLGSYIIYNKTDEFSNEGVHCKKALFWCKDEDWECETNGDFVIPDNVEQLTMIKWDRPFDDALMNGGFAHLQVLSLRMCEIDYLINVAFAQQLLQNLSFLTVEECDYIEEIIETEEEPLEDSRRANYPTIRLPRLRSLRLVDLPRLRSIYSGKMELPSLEELEIAGCDGLERLPFFDLVKVEEMRGFITPKKWRDSLKYHNQHQQYVFEKLFSKFKEYEFDFSDSESELESESEAETETEME